MKNSPLVLIAGAVVFSFTSFGCRVPVEETVTIPVQTIPGFVIPAGTGLAPVTWTLPPTTGSVSIPLNQATYVQKFALRSVFNDPADQTDDALQNDALVGQCPAGRAHLGFVTAVTVRVRHQGEPDSAGVVLASYTKAEGSDPCGFYLTPAGVDIEPYLADYAFVTEVTGLPPVQDTMVGGYVTVKAEEGLF